MLQTESNNLNGSFTNTEARRKYPKDREGPKNEWKALIQHQTDMTNQIVQFEKDLIILKAKQLGKAYDQQLQGQIEDKEYQLKLKKKDAEQMIQKIKQFEIEENQSRLDKLALQRMQADNHQTKIRESQAFLAEEKRKNMELEKSHLIDNQGMIEAERQNEARKKNEMKNFLNGERDNFYQRKNQEKQQNNQFRQQYLQQIEENNQKQQIKEENYKNFFLSTAENQNQKARYHKEKILPELQRKEQNLLDSIDRKVEEVQRRNEAKFTFEKALKEESKRNHYQSLQMQINANKQKNAFEGQDKQNHLQDDQRKQEEYQKYLEDVGKEKKLQQQSYKNLLDKQRQELNDLGRENKMNKAEKKMNFDDLQAYKGIQPTIHTLIPGLVHTKHDFHGSPALKPLLNMSNNTAGDAQRTAMQTYRPAGISGPIYSPQTKFNPVSTKGLSIGHDPTIQLYNDGANAYSNQLQPTQDSTTSRSNLQNPLNRQVIASPGIEEKKATLAEMQELNIRGGHNPLYNPIPYNIQNPYILKQLQSNRGRPNLQTNFLANIASTNLINAGSS